jgi:cysteine synthase
MFLQSRPADSINEVGGVSIAVKEGENSSSQENISSDGAALLLWARLAIAVTLNGDIDYLFCAASACGAIRGCSKYVRERKLKTKMFAVDAVGCIIFSGHHPQTWRGWTFRTQTSDYLAE